MPNQIAIEWTRQGIAGVCAQVAKSKVRVTDTFHFPWPDEIDSVGDPQQAGAWLKSQFDRLGIRGRQVDVVVPREDVVVRRLEVPDAAPQTLANLVRYQAGLMSSVPLDHLVLDFVPLPAEAAASGRGVLLATAGRPQIESVAAVLRVAGFAPNCVAISSVATLELVARWLRHAGRRPDETSVVLARSGERIEVSALHDRCVLFTHAARVLGDTPSQRSRSILAEVSRALTAFRPDPADIRIDRMCLIGVAGEGERAELVPRLREQWGCEVEPIDRFDAIGVEGKTADMQPGAAVVASLLGTLLSHRDAVLRETLDLWNPRQPSSAGSRPGWRWGLVAAGLLLLIAAGYAVRHFYLRALDDQIAQKRLEDQQLGLVLSQGEPTLRAVAAIDEWAAGDVNLLEQMEAISKSMPVADRMVLRNCRLQLVVGDAVARLQADGFARERADVETLDQQLADEQGFRVRPNQIQTGASFEKYPVRFEIDADIVRPSPAGN